jgi:rhodanese-related sulfurtransferase
MKPCFLMLALLALWPASIGWAVEHTKDSLDKVKQQLAEKKAVLVDVREQGEWDLGHVRDAQLIPLSELKRVASDPAIKEKLTKSLPQDRVVYCHCAKGVRALMAGSVLEKLGYDVRPLSAGFDQLRDAGFPTVKKN